MTEDPSLFVLEPSVSARRRNLARLRALSEKPDFDLDAIKKRLKEIREGAIDESKRYLLAFERAAKTRGINVYIADDEKDAAAYIRKASKGYKHALINRSATAGDLVPALEKEGLSVVDTYAAEERTEAGTESPFQWQLGEPVPQTIWESFEAPSKAPFMGRPLPVPDGKWAGVVGLSAASSKDGALYFVQHTHNLSKVLYCAPKLFVVGGVEKIVGNRDDALFQARCAALFGLPAILSDAAARGHSETLSCAAEDVLFAPDITGELHVVLIDGGRKDLMHSDNKRIMECIGCKSCRRGCMISKLGIGAPRDAALKGLSVGPAETERRGLFECTLCEFCKSACPLEIPTNEYNLALRRKLATKGGTPEVHRTQETNIFEKGNPFGDAPSFRGQFYPSVRPSKGAPVLLYLGCVASFQRQKIVESAFKVLSAAGKEFSVLGDNERCCGYPLYVSGSKKFEDAAGSNLRSIKASGAKTVVTTCAGCNKTLSKIYPEYFDTDLEVVHIAEYLGRLATKGELKFPGELKLKAVYHDPCDLGRAMGVYEPPRDLLAAVPGLTLLEFGRNRQSSRCCGAGGGAKGYDAKLSEANALKKMLEAADLGTDVVTSACPACLANLQITIPKVKKETGRSLRFMDISEIAARAMEPK